MRFEHVTPPRVARRKRVSALGGFTILEVAIAATVMLVAIVGSITTLQRGFQALDTARAYTYASQVMQSEIERLRLYDWPQLQALQDSGNTTVSATAVPGTTSSFSCTRTIVDLKPQMKQITLDASWVGHDGRPHNVRLVTRYSQSGLYDYFYTTH